MRLPKFKNIYDVIEARSGPAAIESVMTVLTNFEHANGKRLIKELGAQGFFDILPEFVRGGFMDQVLKTLPFLRNKLGGLDHRKGIMAFSPIHGDIAIQIAVDFQNFLIT